MAEFLALSSQRLVSTTRDQTGGKTAVTMSSSAAVVYVTEARRIPPFHVSAEQMCRVLRHVQERLPSARVTLARNNLCGVDVAYDGDDVPGQQIVVTLYLFPMCARVNGWSKLSHDLGWRVIECRSSVDAFKEGCREWQVFVEGLFLHNLRSRGWCIFVPNITPEWLQRALKNVEVARRREVLLLGRSLEARYGNPLYHLWRVAIFPRASPNLCVHRVVNETRRIVA
jgi:hypothetical protein